LELRAELARAARPERDVRVAAERPLLHIAVRDPEIDQDRPKRLEVRRRLVGRAEVGLGNGFHERDARAVEIHEARPGGLERALVEELADVLLEVETLDADGARRTIDLDVERAVFGERLFVLADLEVLGHVRVVVVLAREAARGVHSTVEGESRADAELDRPAVDDGEHAGHPLADRARLAVRRRAEGRRAAAEHLRARAELCVDLEPDDDLPVCWTGVRESGSHGRWPIRGAVWLRNSVLTGGGLSEVRRGSVRSCPARPPRAPGGRLLVRVRGA